MFSPNWGEVEMLWPGCERGNVKVRGGSWGRTGAKVQRKGADLSELLGEQNTVPVL